MHWHRTFHRFVFCLALICALIAIYLHSPWGKHGKQNAARKSPPNPERPLPPSSSPTYRYKQAGIITDNIACSLIARETLTMGGSAVDGALAALICNGFIGMQSMGLGGGLLMNVYVHSERRSYSILSREFAPRFLNAENFTIFETEAQFKQSAWSIAVPTELLGYAVAHERFGKLPWQELVRPTILLCHTGYPLYKHQHDALVLNGQMVKSDELLSRMFVDPKTGQFYPIGTHIEPPTQLCDTYEHIARKGPRSFYKGSLLANVYADLLELGSGITMDDLTYAQADLTDSIVVPLNEYELHLTPPPGSGHIVGFIMNILRAYRADFAAARNLGPLEIHRIVEALKFGFVQRWQLDTAAEKELLAKLTSYTFAANIAKLMNDTKTYNNSEHYGITPDMESRQEHGTAHISVLHNNDAVSVTSSINFYFGSGRMGKRTGVLFNNAMSDFSLRHLKNYFDLPFVEGRNMVVGSARPMSSMCPVIVTERETGQVRLVVGAAGGTKIISALVPLLVRMLWQQADIKGAIDANRFHHQMLPNVLQFEYGMQQAHVNALRLKGHQCERYRNRGSVICGIAQDNGTISINSDYRKIGGVAGF